MELIYVISGLIGCALFYTIVKATGEQYEMNIQAKKDAKLYAENRENERVQQLEHNRKFKISTLKAAKSHSREFLISCIQSRKDMIDSDNYPKGVNAEGAKLTFEIYTAELAKRDKKAKAIKEGTYILEYELLPHDAHEWQLEEWFHKALNAMGHKSWHNDPHYNAGVPDCSVIFSDGEAWFVELKTDKGRLNNGQWKYYHLMKKMGVNICYLHGQDEMREFIKTRVGR